MKGAVRSCLRQLIAPLRGKSQVAIYRCEVKAVQRSKGRSSTAAAAYRAGEQITDERTGEVHDYRRKTGVVESGLTMPEGEGWSPSRPTLWNAAEAGEKRKDGTPAREHIIALPHELNDAQRSELVKGYAQDLSNRHGCAVDYAIHEPAEKGDDRNHHAHILRTTRKVDGEGLGEKCAVEKAGRDRRADLLAERQNWEQHCNRALERAGRDERVDHRSHEERGDGLAPEPKQGPTATAMERRGAPSERGDERRQTKRDNWRRREIGDELNQAEAKADQLNQEQRHERIEATRRTARAHGIEPVNQSTGSAPGQRRDQVQPAPGGAGLGQALGKGIKKAGKPGQPKKSKPGQQTEKDVESSFKKFTSKFQALAEQMLGALQKRDEQPAPAPKPAGQKAQPSTPRAAPKIEARPEPKADARPSAAYAAKVLEIDAKLNRDQGATGLQRLAKGASKENDPQRGAMLHRQLSERAQGIAQRASAGDPTARAEVQAAAARLSKADPLALANAEKNHDRRTKRTGLELSTDRLAKLAADDLPGLDKALAAGKPPAVATIAAQAKQLGDTLPTKKGPTNVMKGPRG